jgi:DNA-binding NtrC family response regulator
LGSAIGQVTFIAPAGSAVCRTCAGILDKRAILWSRFRDHAALCCALSRPDADLPTVVVVEADENALLPEKLVELVKELRSRTGAEVMILGRKPTAELMLKVLNAGAGEYLALSDVKKAPMAFCTLIARICAERQAATSETKAVVQSDAGLFMGRSPQLLKVISEAVKALAEDAVLLQGESGAGKSFLATAVLRECFPARYANFVRVDCGALSESLKEAELFGWLGESFTGSGKDERAGLFERANKGVLFLDEIGSLPTSQQKSLLMALESNRANPFLKTIRKIGGKETTVDVQVIAATQYDLLDRVHHGDFLEPLYFRITRLCITVPALRDRREDIPYLALRLLWSESARMNRKFVKFSDEAIDLLQRYRWPGNVRELSNVISSAVRMNRGRVLEADQLPEQITGCGRKAGQRTLYGEELVRLKTGLLSAELERMAETFYRGTVQFPDGTSGAFCDVASDDTAKRGQLANRLGVARSTLWKRLPRKPPSK